MTPVLRLEVVLYQRHVGTIERAGASITFNYDPDYLKLPDATPLSLSMPLSPAPYGNRHVEAHLRGLLPDNDNVRRRWAAQFGLRDRDTVGLIAHIGTDTAGGALYIPTQDYPAALDHGHVTAITEADIAERLRRLRQDDADWLHEGEHWSLAGAQSKFTLRQLENGWGIADGNEPSTHIVKPGISRIPGQAVIEHVSMAAATAVGCDVAQTSYTEFEDQPAIIVTRFDRRHLEGGWQRIHQEDFCQTFALDPMRKYETDGGPGTIQIIRHLQAHADADSVERFVKNLIVNYLLGAPDAHAKNYSLLLLGNTVTLAPGYDIASGLTLHRGDRLRFPAAAMSIGGERAFGEMRGKHWEKFARNIEISPHTLRTWVTEIAEALPDAVRDAAAELPKPVQEHAALATLTGCVAAAAKLTLERLDDMRSGRKQGPSGAQLIVENAVTGIENAAPAEQPYPQDSVGTE